MESVFVLTSGAYSDYGIRGVFSTREAAQATADLMNGDEGEDAYGAYGVEEWPLDTVPMVPMFRARAAVRTARQVKVNGMWTLVAESSPVVTVYDAPPWSKSDEPVAADRPSITLNWQIRARGQPLYGCDVDVKADSPERAKKIAAERAYQLAAEWDIEVERARQSGDLTG